MKTLPTLMLATLSLLVGCKSNSDPFGDVSKYEFTGKVAKVDQASNLIAIEGTGGSRGTFTFTFSSDTKFFENKQRIAPKDLVIGKEGKYRFKDDRKHRPVLVSFYVPAADLK